MASRDDKLSPTGIAGTTQLVFSFSRRSELPYASYRAVLNVCPCSAYMSKARRKKVTAAVRMGGGSDVYCTSCVKLFLAIHVLPLHPFYFCQSLGFLWSVVTDHTKFFQ